MDIFSGCLNPDMDTQYDKLVNRDVTQWNSYSSLNLSKGDLPVERIDYRYKDNCDTADLGHKGRIAVLGIRFHDGRFVERGSFEEGYTDSQSMELSNQQTARIGNEQPLKIQGLQFSQATYAKIASANLAKSILKPKAQRKYLPNTTASQINQPMAKRNSKQHFGLSLMRLDTVGMYPMSKMNIKRVLCSDNKSRIFEQEMELDNKIARGIICATFRYFLPGSASEKDRNIRFVTVLQPSEADNHSKTAIRIYPTTSQDWLHFKMIADCIPEQLQCLQRVYQNGLVDAGIFDASTVKETHAQLHKKLNGLRNSMKHSNSMKDELLDDPKLIHIAVPEATTGYNQLLNFYRQNMKAICLTKKARVCGYDDKICLASREDVAKFDGEAQLLNDLEINLRQINKKCQTSFTGQTSIGIVDDSLVGNSENQECNIQLLLEVNRYIYYGHPNLTKDISARTKVVLDRRLFKDISQSRAETHTASRVYPRQNMASRPVLKSYAKPSATLLPKPKFCCNSKIVPTTILEVDIKPANSSRLASGANLSQVASTTANYEPVPTASANSVNLPQNTSIPVNSTVVELTHKHKAAFSLLNSPITTDAKNNTIEHSAKKGTTISS